MEERKITVKLDGKDYEIYAGNAALRRFRLAGGDLSFMEKLDFGDDPNDEQIQEALGGLTGILETMDHMALLIAANAVKKDLTVEDVLNGCSEMQDLFLIVNDIFTGVPWLKNQAAAGKKPNDPSGPSQSQLSDGTPTNTGKLAASSSSK